MGSSVTIPVAGVRTRGGGAGTVPVVETLGFVCWRDGDGGSGRVPVAAVLGCSCLLTAFPCDGEVG